MAASRVQILRQLLPAGGHCRELFSASQHIFRRTGGVLSCQPGGPFHLPTSHFNQGRLMYGPGADRKYRSEVEVRQEAESQRDAKRRRLIGGGLAAGVLIGASWGYLVAKRSRDTSHQISNDSQSREYLLAESPPPFPPARQIRNPADATGLKITLYQYQTCPFCCKARAFLDYFGLSYDVVEVNSVLRTQVKWSKYKKVPILVVQTKDNKLIQVNDSSVIVSALYSLLVDPDGGLEAVMDCFPALRYIDQDGKEKEEIQNKYFLMYQEGKVNRTKEDIVEERKWRKWADDSLVHTLSPNVYRSPTEALEAFRWFDTVGGWPDLFSAWERYLVIYAGAAVMWLIGKRLKRRHQLKDNVRESLYDECNTWTKALKKKGTPFMGGSTPNLADLAVFGVLSAIQGCQAFQDARANTKIGVWFDLMAEQVRQRQGQSLLQPA